MVSVHCGAGRDQTLVLFIKGFVLINPHIPLINFYFFSVANLFRTNPQTVMIIWRKSLSCVWCDLHTDIKVSRIIEHLAFPSKLMGEIERITVQEFPNGHQVFGRPSVLFQFSSVHFVNNWYKQLLTHWLKDLTCGSWKIFKKIGYNFEKRSYPIIVNSSAKFVDVMIWLRYLSSLTLKTNQSINRSMITSVITIPTTTVANSNSIIQKKEENNNVRTLL